MNTLEILWLIYIGVGIIGYIIGWFWMAWMMVNEEEDLIDAVGMIFLGSIMGFFVLAVWPVSAIVFLLWAIAQKKKEAKKQALRDRRSGSSW